MPLGLLLKISCQESIIALSNHTGFRCGQEMWMQIHNIPASFATFENLSVFSGLLA